MLLSMTGFGKATAELSNKKITVEIKSLNSKQLDFNARIPSVFRSAELELRNIISHKLERGKIDMNISVENSPATITTHINTEALRNYKNQICEASKNIDVPCPTDWWSILLRFPDVMISENDDNCEAEEHEALKQAVTEAVDGLMEYRRAEGLKLEAFFAERISAITNLLQMVPQYENERIEHIKSRLADGLSKIPVVDYDKGRLEQEMIFYIEKLDVNEEKQRLGQHLEYFMETMAQTPGQGKKLGFIAQEMGREINTLGSKSNHAEMQKIVVLMKDNLEQIKEQVLNVM